MKNPLIKLLTMALAAVPLAGAVQGAVLLDNTSLIAAPTAAAPAEFSFTTTTAEALTVTLTDLQAPAAFGTLQIAVTLGDTLIGSASIDSTSPTSPTTATVAIPAGTGNYVLHVVGTPDPTATVGTFGACVTRNSDPAPRSCVAAYSFSGNLQTPSAGSASSNGFTANFTSSAAAGVYTVTVTDDTFPAALTSVAGGISQGSSPVNTTPFALGTNQVTLAAGTIYTLVLGAVPDPGTLMGLYGVHIVDPNGTPVFDRTVPVGNLPISTVVNNPIAGALTLTLDDLGYPAPLANAQVAVTSGSSALAVLPAAGSSPLTAPAGSLQIWQYIVPGSQPGVYTLNLSNGSGAPALYSATQVVDLPASSAPPSYAFVQNLTAAGSYQVLVNDFSFPSALVAAPVATVAQNGVVLQQSSTGVFTADTGNIVILVTASPASSTSGGIFGVTLQTSATTPQVLLSQTQAVGATFSTQSVTVATAGSYDVTLTDLGFPLNFGSLDVVVSQGNQVVGKIFGGGTFSFSGTPGAYLLTFVDTPATKAPTPAPTPPPTLGYGLYSVRVQSSSPTLTFSSSASTVTAGQSVTLTWNATNATSCTAGGSSAWTGNEPASGTASVVISATATLTLTCTSDGGTATQSVTVTATPAASSSGGGGGGSLNWAFLAALALLTGGVRWQRHVTAFRHHELRGLVH